MVSGVTATTSMDPRGGLEDSTTRRPASMLSVETGTALSTVISEADVYDSPKEPAGPVCPAASMISSLLADPHKFHIEIFLLKNLS